MVLRLSTGCGLQFRFAFIQEDDISYRWLTIGESANTTQKGVSTLPKNQQLSFLRHSDDIWSRVSMEC